MTRRITRHPSDPAPDQGAITVWSEREHAVSAFRISAPAGAVELLDLDRRVTVPAHGPAAVEDVLGSIVFPDVASYRRGSAWQLATVLERLGVDAGELAEVELADDEALFGLACDDSSHDLRDGACALCGMLEGDVMRDRRSALTRCRTGRATDADRIALATRKGDLMNGPLECQPCAQHPRRKLTVRWFWDVPEDGDHTTAVSSSEPEIVRGCAQCAKENE